MIDILGNIPKEYILIMRNDAASTVAFDYLTRFPNKFSVAILDIGYNSDIEHLKAVARKSRLKVEVHKPARAINDGECFFSYQIRMEQELAKSLSPATVVNPIMLSQAIMFYLTSCFKLNPFYPGYYYHNMICPFILVSDEEMDHWATIKNLGELPHVSREGKLKALKLIERHIPIVDSEFISTFKQRIKNQIKKTKNKVSSNEVISK